MVQFVRALKAGVDVAQEGGDGDVEDAAEGVRPNLDIQLHNDIKNDDSPLAVENNIDVPNADAAGPRGARANGDALRNLAKAGCKLMCSFVVLATSLMIIALVNTCLFSEPLVESSIKIGDCIWHQMYDGVTSEIVVNDTPACRQVFKQEKNKQQREVLFLVGLYDLDLEETNISRVFLTSHYAASGKAK